MTAASASRRNSVECFDRLKDGRGQFLEDYQTLPDAELVNLVNRAADEAAFAEIVRRSSPRVFRFASRFFRQYAQVEEMAQEVFLKAFTQLKNFEGRGSLEGWLTRITVNTCINALRATKPQNEKTFADLSDDETGWLENQLSAARQTESTAEEKLVAADLVNRVLETLPKDWRVVLTLIETEGFSMKEVAETLNWSESKVKVTAFRARRKMRESIEKLLKGK
ncbi:MAG: RNA polymerase sigma factor [Pyrinomonadaceae bacterium]